MTRIAGRDSFVEVKILPVYEITAGATMVCCESSIPGPRLGYIMCSKSAKVDINA